MKVEIKRCSRCKRFIGDNGQQAGGHDKKWYCHPCYQEGLKMEYEAMGLLDSSDLT